MEVIKKKLIVQNLDTGREFGCTLPELIEQITAGADALGVRSFGLTEWAWFLIPADCMSEIRRKGQEPRLLLILNEYAFSYRSAGALVSVFELSDGLTAGEYAQFVQGVRLDLIRCGFPELLQWGLESSGESHPEQAAILPDGNQYPLPVCDKAVSERAPFYALELDRVERLKMLTLPCNRVKIEQQAQALLDRDASAPARGSGTDTVPPELLPGFPPELPPELADSAPAQEHGTCLTSFVPMSAESALARLRDRTAQEQAFDTPSGIAEIDRRLGGGLPEKGVILIGAEPAAGKTLLVQNIAEGLSAAGRPVLFYSFEMTESELYKRSLLMSFRGAIRDETGADRIYRAPFPGASSFGYTPETRTVKIAGDWIRETGMREPLAGVDAAGEPWRARLKNFYFMTAESPHIEDVCASIDQFAGTHPGVTPVVVIDYLQNLRTYNGKVDRVRELEQIAGKLKDYGQNKCLLFVVSSLNRESQRAVRALTRDSFDRTPLLNGFKGSGDLEYSANLAFLIYRAGRDENPSPDERKTMTLVCAKARDRDPAELDICLRLDPRFYWVDPRNRGVPPAFLRDCAQRPEEQPAPAAQRQPAPAQKKRTSARTPV